MPALDLSFLGATMPRLKTPRVDVNVFDVLGLSGSELAADQTLAFFFDPNERHGMGTAMVHALLSLLDGAPLLTATAATCDVFAAGEFSSDTGWYIDRQVSAGDPDEGQSTLSWQGIIDIYITNPDLGLAIIIENKIGAELHNPLESYVRHALDEGYQTVLLVVLAPYHHRLTNEATPWVSRTLTYAALFDSLRATPRGDKSPMSADINERRSAALLEQFQEIRERNAAIVDYSTEAEFVEEFRQAIDGQQEALSRFFATQRQINKIYRQRSERLRPLIDERMRGAGLATGWEAHGFNSGHWTYAWNAYELTESNNSVELILCPDPLYTASISAKAYPDRSYKYYPEADHVPIGVEWATPDEDVADAFIAFSLGVVAQHPSTV